MTKAEIVAEIASKTGIEKGAVQNGMLLRISWKW